METTLTRKEEEKRLLDEFAMRAMQGIVGAFYSLVTHHGWTIEDITKESYNIAEKMIEERRKRNI